MNDSQQQLEISPSGLMDLENAAKYLGCKIDTLRWLRRMKKLPFVKLGQRLMVKQRDLDNYIESKTEPVR